jgi:P27 family predicted phage terminase small subunit
MSRPKHSRELAELKGQVSDWSRDRTDYSESGIQSAIPKPPKFLSKEAKKKFKQSARELARRRAITAGDADLLTLYASLWERWTAALAKIRDEGIVVAYDHFNKKGDVIQTEKPNLHLAIAKDCEKQMAAILSKLGLTPKDRDAVKPTKPNAKELGPVPGSLEDLMNRMEQFGVAPDPAIPDPSTEEEPDGDKNSEE